MTSVRVTTMPSRNYNQLSKSVVGQNSLVVRVQACRDAHIALSQLFNNIITGTYEIIIGGYGNMKSFIRDAATYDEHLSVDTPNIMDCTNYKTFWVKWDSDYRLTVGRGAVVGTDTFLDWIDPQQRIFQGVTISTWNDAEGLWDFSFLDGELHMSVVTGFLNH